MPEWLIDMPDWLHWVLIIFVGILFSEHIITRARRKV
jgi:hypothetical protein